MKLKNICILLFFLIGFSTHLVSAQSIRGVATYSSRTTIELSDFEGRNMSDDKKRQFASIMQDFFNREYQLEFDSVSSLYKEKDQLARPGSDDRLNRKFGMFLEGPQYVNISENRYVQSQEFLGKTFLIIDEIHNLSWEILDETKNIGQFTCYKAKTYVNAQLLDWRDSIRKNDDLSNSSLEDKIEVSAWFTKEIPVSHGPNSFYGLPGLIMEVEYNGRTITCIRVSVQSKEPAQIKAPKKGKKVSKSEYALIVETKLKELKQQNSARRRERRKN